MKIVVVVLIVLMAVLYGATRSDTATTNKNSQQQTCENTVHQQYDPQIAAAMSSGTSQQPMFEEQAALQTCQRQYSN